MDLFWQQLSAIDSWIRLVPLVKSTVLSFTNRVRSVNAQQPTPKGKKTRAPTKRTVPSAQSNAKHTPDTTENSTHDLPGGDTLQDKLTGASEMATSVTDDGRSKGQSSGFLGGEDLLQQLDAQKEKRRLLKEKIEVMQNVMAQLSRGDRFPSNLAVSS